MSQGWRNKPNLYALTIFKINGIAKLEVREADKPLGFWHQCNNPWLTDKIQPGPAREPLFLSTAPVQPQPRLACGLANTSR